MRQKDLFSDLFTFAHGHVSLSVIYSLLPPAGVWPAVRLKPQAYAQPNAGGPRLRAALPARHGVRHFSAALLSVVLISTPLPRPPGGYPVVVPIDCSCWRTASLRRTRWRLRCRCQLVRCRKPSRQRDRSVAPFCRAGKRSRTPDGKATAPDGAVNLHATLPGGSAAVDSLQVSNQSRFSSLWEDIPSTKIFSHKPAKFPKPAPGQLLL